MQSLKKILKLLGLYSMITDVYDFYNHKQRFFELKRQIVSLDTNKRVFFFFPFYHTGGAELVHLNIVRSVKDLPTLTFFTLPSGDEDLINDFHNASECFDIQLFIRNKKEKKNLIKIIAQKINTQENPVVFTCHCSFFYELLPYLEEKVRCIDLIHAFTGIDEPGHEKESLPYLKMINKRVVITNQVKSQLNELYKEKGIYKNEAEKIQVIYNATHLTNFYEIKKDKEKITLIYAGRNSPEKRIHVIGQIASLLKQMNLKFEMVIIGSNLEEGINLNDRSSCTFLGALSQDEIAEWYQKAHAVLITSKREGFPMVFMEGMVFGCIPISTNVGGIPELINNEETGILIENSLDENELVGNFTKEIVSLFENIEKYQKISSTCLEFAQHHFTMERFNKEYRNLLLADVAAA
jgi:glycosyltransferase involved in cell wall biosynthesis